jgi:hypothetical protein
MKRLTCLTEVTIVVASITLGVYVRAGLTACSIDRNSLIRIAYFFARKCCTGRIYSKFRFATLTGEDAISE